MFLASTTRSRSNLPARICTSRSVPPARTRAEGPKLGKLLHRVFYGGGRYIFEKLHSCSSKLHDTNKGEDLFVAGRPTRTKQAARLPLSLANPVERILFYYSCDPRSKTNSRNRAMLFNSGFAVTFVPLYVSK